MNGLVKDAPPRNSLAVDSFEPGHHKWLGRILIALALLLAAGLILLALNWPFTQSKVIANLQDAMQGKVTIGRFHHTFFPHPGCVAEDVTFTGYGNLSGASPITVRKLTIEGSFRGMFTRHVPLMRAEGVHVSAAGAHAFAGWKSGSGTHAIVDQLLVTDSVLEFSHGRSQALKFEIATLTLTNPTGNAPLRFETILRNPLPPGEVRAAGTLGPWRSDGSSQTPLVGVYNFNNADLAAFHAIAGTLSSQGSFQGTLGQLEVRGQTETPDFELTDTGHKIGLSTEFQARVNTENGDVGLESVAARLGKSGVNAEGKVSGVAGQPGKTASMELGLRDARIQDFLFLFLNDRLPPMNGVFSFEGKARLPSGPQPFIERVELQGRFGVSQATLSKSSTQSKLESLSERAEGEKDEDPERVVSDLEGHVSLRRGIAAFSQLTFRVPGAKARLQGTYSLLDHRIDLHGRLLTLATLPQATGGVQSFLLKIISPLLKRNRHGGGVLALSVTGVYPQPVYKTAPLTHPF